MPGFEDSLLRLRGGSGERPRDGDLKLGLTKRCSSKEAGDCAIRGEVACFFLRDLAVGLSPTPYASSPYL